MSAVVGTLAVWCVALIVAGYAAAGCEQRVIAARIGRSFDATARFDDASLSLLRGRFVGDRLHIEKSEALGSLRVEVRSLEADLAPLGLALIDSDPRSVRLSGVELEASSLALLRPRRGHGKPFAVDSLELVDVHLAAMPTMLVPSMGRLEVQIDRARAGPTVLRTALSWVFSLEELVARIDLPGGVTVRLAYANGRMRASGGMFGATPVEIPFAIPVLDPLHEMEQLAALGLDLAEAMTLRQAESWLRDGWDAIKRAVPTP